MSQKILGIDLGSSSIGMALRNPNINDNLVEQLEYFSVDIFKAGVGMNKSGEYSLAAERTKNRQTRRLYETRRRRLWATLELLIKEGYCPMKMESLIKWKTYDKSKGLFRKYPIEDLDFDRWIKLDFDGDGKPDYSSPYQLRDELMQRQFDFTNVEEKYKLGRALYHIAQRRGFKSSKGETIKEQEETDQQPIDDMTVSMKKSEEKKSKALIEFMEENNLETVGCAFALLERKGVRIRNSIYSPVRDLYRDEIKKIFEFQEGLNTESELYLHIMSTKKGEGTIFYKKPLRSQKGLVGNCTLEKNKKRCPVSHPSYEYFRAWTFLNNIKYRTDINEKWTELTKEQKEAIYNDIFIGKVRRDFQFKDIREKLQRLLGIPLLVYSRDNNKTINYKDTQNVAGCPVTARLIRLLGDEWQTVKIEGNKHRYSKGGKLDHKVSYDANDLWNVCFNADDPEDVTIFAQNRLGWDEEKTKLLLRLWSSLQQGYAMLSLKAINNINYMLTRGLKYSDAVLLAKIPELIESNESILTEIINDYKLIKKDCDIKKTINSITNSLIASYKSLDYKDRFAEKNFDYKLDESDHRDILQTALSILGKNKWESLEESEREEIIEGVKIGYQHFFADYKRDFIKINRLDDDLKQYLLSNYDVSEKQLEKLYHPSQISLYTASPNNGDPLDLRLGSPNIGSIRNPVVMRALNVLRKKINKMLDAGLITSDDTRIVVETTRSINDANMRWAIEQYQKERETERKTIEAILREYYPTRDINATDIDKASYIIEQKDIDTYKPGRNFALNVSKYKLWLEQGCCCMYTGKQISLSNLLNGDECDVEHTIPRSISFDNSDANLTVCDSFFNRSIKRNQLPTQLPNYEKDIEIGGKIYSAIKPRLEKWEEKVEKLTDMVNFWKSRSRNAQDKTRKDQCIRQRHLWQMQLDYWKQKLYAFTCTEVKEGSRRSQLVDTGIITKYATLYLKRVFNNVEVQKGHNTAVYRKMLGIQSIDEKKDRSLHSHHAIDACVLTCIPVAAKRERMLKLYYEIQEAKQLGHDWSTLEHQLQDEIKDCGFGRKPEAIVEIINNNLIVNHHSKDQTLRKNRKRVRINGKKVYSKDINGNRKELWSDGDSISGRLHKESFYGAIKLPVGDESSNDYIPKVENGHFVYDNSEKDHVIVMRLEIRDKDKFSKISDFDKVIDPSIRKQLIMIVEQRMAQGMSFVEAVNKEIYLLDKSGHEIKEDKNGRKLSPLRHVRCRVKAGRGYMSYSTSISIRHQVNKSKKQMMNINDRTHKEFLYAQNDDDGNYALLIYEGFVKGKTKRISHIVNLFELSLLSRDFKGKAFSFYDIPSYNVKNIKGVEYKLKQIIKTNTRVILLDNEVDAQSIIFQNDLLSKRIYRVMKFNTSGIFLMHHLLASTDDKEAIKMTVNSINCLVEGIDFEINELGNVIMKK